MTLDGPAHLPELLDIQWPIIQASIAGTGTPALAAAVSNAGGLGSLGVGATNAEHSIKTFCLWVATLGSNSRIVVRASSESTLSRMRSVSRPFFNSAQVTHHAVAASLLLTVLQEIV